MKYIVFGGAGFVGHYLVQALREAGEQVLVCDLVAPGENELRGGVNSLLLTLRNQNR